MRWYATSTNVSDYSNICRLPKREWTIKNFIFLIDEAELHLHPTAQRKLKNSLIELSNQGDQIIITSHSSVLIADDFDKQSCFKVEKNDKVTDIKSILGTEKKDVVYDSFLLLGGSPADLLLPRNFLLVEGTSDKLFIDKIIQNFYSDKPIIQVVPVWGDIEKTERVLDYLWSIFAPLDKSLYQSTLLLDKVSIDRQDAFSEFLRKYPQIQRNKANQVIELPVWSLEEYYPIAEEGQTWWHNQAVKWQRSSAEVSSMSSIDKHLLAKHVAKQIKRNNLRTWLKFITLFRNAEQLPLRQPKIFWLIC